MSNKKTNKMKNIIKILMVAMIAIGVTSCNSIDGESSGEYTVIYYGNLAGVDLVADDCGYVWINVDVDKDGISDFDVVLANSFIPKINEIQNKMIELRVVSGSKKAYNGQSWYVVDILSQPDVKDYLNFEEQFDTTKIIVK